MDTPHDQGSRRPLPPAAPGAAQRGNEVGPSTGMLLARFGERVGQPPPPRPARAARRPLLPTAVAPDAVPLVVQTLLNTLAASDPAAPTRAHAIAEYAVTIARSLAPANEVPRIRQAALLCNIGMAAVPREVVQQAVELTPDEQQLVRRHPIHGAELLHEHAALADLILPVLHHHEDYDGGGYPYGLSGEWIPLGARIIRVAETYDALLQPRPYRPALAPADALAALHAGTGRHFDPRCVATLAVHVAR